MSRLIHIRKPELSAEGAVVLNPKEKMKHTVHVTKDLILLLKYNLLFNNPEVDGNTFCVHIE